MSYLEMLEESGLDYSASDEEILAIEGIGPATLEKIRGEPEDPKVVATRALVIKEDGERMSVISGDELPDWDIVDELIEKGQAKVV